jgi:hypothetical protein
MDAVITIKMTASEFDTLRKAVEGYADEQHRIVTDKDSSPGQHSVARTNEAQARDLLTKIT